jgi:hypothetical protein
VCCTPLRLCKKSGSMYSTIGSGMASQATPQGRRHNRANVASYAQGWCREQIMKDICYRALKVCRLLDSRVSCVLNIKVKRKDWFSTLQETKLKPTSSLSFWFKFRLAIHQSYPLELQAVLLQIQTKIGHQICI